MKYINSEGSFDCITTEPTAGWIGESGEKQTPFIRISVQVTEDGPEKGSGAVWQGWLSNNAFENTIKRLAEVFGFDGNLATLVAGKQTLAGRPCNITTEFEDYNGKRQCKVKWLNAAGGGAAKPMDVQKLDNLVAQLNKRSMLIAQSMGAKPQTKSEPVESLSGDGDSVPF